MKKFFSAIGTILLIAPVFSFAQTNPVKQEKLSRFEMQSTYIVKESGKTISTAGYQSKNYWFPVTVPSTVLSGLVANNVYASPYQGMNNMFIPDASDEFNEQYGLGKYSFIPNVSNPWNKPYWYRTTFRVPASDKDKLFQLIFKGINYRAAVWVNGQEIADTSQMVGMFAEYALNVSKAILPGKENVLAVQIYPLDYPGLPDTPQVKGLGDFYLNGGPTGDIGKNVTMLCSVGWDWMPAVRDRNMGIWQPVFLRTSGKVTIDRPRIVTHLPALPDTSSAELSLEFNLFNHDAANQNGQVTVTISPENFTGKPFTIQKQVALNGDGPVKVALNAQNTPQFKINQPQLWWPNGYGKPNLYRIRMQYRAGNQVLDDTTFMFGIRTIDTKATDVNGWTRREFYVNGKRIHVNGGAWVPDMMLNRDSARYAHEVALCRNSNINLLRIWGGGITPPDVFFDLADRYGMLVWNDFWVTGDTQGEFKGSPDWPLQSNVFINNMTSSIYRIRNHPSLLLWTGGNEGHARKELYDAMRDSIIHLDGTRPFIPSSSGYAKLPVGWKGSWPDGKPSGVYSSGPYSWQDAAVYYQKVNQKTDWLFKDETGIPSQPPFASLGKIIPNLVPDSTLPYPLNNTWGYHDAATGNGRYDLYYKAMEDRYGKPQSMQDFSLKMQLVNANGYRGIFEAPGSQLNETGGVMLWKLNAAFPSVIWQVYDWYLRPNAGYYFMQRALEPVHIQLNLDDSAVAVVNRTYKPVSGLQASIELLDLNGKLIYSRNAKLKMEPSQVQEIESIASALKQAAGITFVVLKIKNAQGQLISSNTYWLEATHDYKALAQMPAAGVKTELLKREKTGSDISWTFRFTNTSSQLAFFLNPALADKVTGEEVLPSFWSDNYFTLSAGEQKEVTVRCPASLVNGAAELLFEGWNVPKSVVEF